ncbi:MAG: YbhB/YbcL family Raf kinase inhibitor-like protein [Gammaproteobacteria bacterium]|nr:YbhB/YbcL family Raf kinase inhibitor-like protein [Gammaproteobacteria bacterium]MCP4091599.1 YbhB/YbcL family Raf kinase inhibitor-like protein [Gammaproteobacteria bacterium]MCP4276095.1 YbhB/YbcL family Raf kinase inhibitor-like protein [Gammaproteobacteria bacterium]MCP4830839.1 YbhB/YbcL family Raf kinase inhibitor-like protein [Gammaproteobacteria bacterium]MCP4929665.1 YbhB/YbcL family Raf kinase inhibitor-like protein [Gammaproteobacteria bacterium]
MKLTSTSFTNNGVIPDRCAFAIKDAKEHIALGENQNPQLSWSDIPEKARSLVLICIDPDVPTSMDNFNQEGKTISASLRRENFIHWVMIDIPATPGSIKEGECSDGVLPGGKDDPTGPAGSRQGINDYTAFFAGDEDMGGNYFGYEGPCPPWNDELLHHYHFQLLAINLSRVDVEGNFTAEDVLRAIDGHVVEGTEIIGTYSLNPNV